MDRTAGGAVSGDVRRDRRGGGDSVRRRFFRRFRSGGCGYVPVVPARRVRRRCGGNKGDQRVPHALKVYGEASAGSEKNRSRPFGRLPPPSKINPLYLF